MTWTMSRQVLVLLCALAAPFPALAAPGERFAEKSADVNGVRIAYRIGGRGPVVVLLHGYTQTSHMWTPLMRAPPARTP